MEKPLDISVSFFVHPPRNPCWPLRRRLFFVIGNFSWLVRVSGFPPGWVISTEILVGAYQRQFCFPVHKQPIVSYTFVFVAVAQESRRRHVISGVPCNMFAEQCTHKTLPHCLFLRLILPVFQ